MQIPLDLIHPELFYNNPSQFDIVYGIKQMMEIYNMEIKLVWDHLMSSKIPPESKEMDIENILIQKPGTIASKLSSYISALWPDSSFNAAEVITSIQPENISGITDINIQEDFINKSKFLKFFPNEKDKESFIKKVKGDIMTAIANPNTIILIPNQ